MTVVCCPADHGYLSNGQGWARRECAANAAHPSENVSRLGWIYSGAAASRIVSTSCGWAGWVGRWRVRVTRGRLLLGACAVHLLRVRWVGRWRVRLLGAAASRIVFTSLRWRGRWVVSASYSGVMVVRMVFISGGGRRTAVCRGYWGRAASRILCS